MWPPSFAKARAYLDQLERSQELAADKMASARASLASAEKMSGAGRQAALKKLAADVSAASDAPKGRLLAESVAELAKGGVRP